MVMKQGRLGLIASREASRKMKEEIMELIYI
jgi:hypothetical protein